MKRNIQHIKKSTASVAVANEWHRVVESGFGGQSPWTAKQILETLQAKNTIVIGATIGDEKVGLVAASETLFELDIYLVVVSQIHKKKQIGTQLFEEIIQYAKEKKIPEIILEVRASNVPAITLYERVGFKQVGVRKAYYSRPIEDAILMKCEL